mmetsp:Transcript_6582/g.19367  ORF Transcript_6582/g.19367 Transcript_6582/m.19367 type:complete len:231 (+) Transcript_6582:247-939(+)
MLDGVHRHAADFGPLVALHAVLVVRAARLEHRFVRPAAARDDANHGAALGLDGLLAARQEAELRRALLLVVRHDDRVVARAPRERAAVAEARLGVADHRALGDRGDGEDVADRELRLGAAVDEHALVQALGRDHELVVALVAVRVLELDFGQRRAAARLVDDGLDDALDVALLLGEIHLPHLHGALAEPRVRSEDGVLALTAAADGLTHLGDGGTGLRRSALNNTAADKL